MRTDSVKKYVIPNIPYLFVLWACLKLGTAYRLAAGADLPHKLMGLGQTVGPAFADLAPGLDPFDWLIGIVGAVGFRLLIYVKSKNAKKFRRDEEYGSARWGCPKDIAPFVDPVFENNVILTGTELLTMNTRPQNPANARNLNACVIGSSGSGKTRFWLTPQLLQASAKKKGGCSFVVVDPKGGVLSQVGAFLQRRGYRIKVFNSIDFSQSMHYKQARQTARAGAAKAAKKTAAATEKAGAQAVGFIKRHPVGVLLALACLLLLFIMQSCSSSLVMLGNSGAGAVGATTYPSKDEDILGAEAAYADMEAELQNYLDTYESTHDYDEYHFDLDTIEHDPYVLISILSVLHEGEWTLAQVQGTLQMLFDRQYILTERVVRETRYDSEGDPYSWYICYVTLENKTLSHLPLELMGEEELARYALYMSCLGNRPDLFPESGYVDKYTKPPADYDVPEEYLDDETFAAILGEAEKYLGYPYVWGGSSPATSFDCSGFVSWVINHSGWDVGRLGAQGLYNICTPTGAPRPGDLVFFEGTYDTTGVSHCGIYVGDGMMIHCGDPISYANLNTNYWQSHFYAYGRLP